MEPQSQVARSGRVIRVVHAGAGTEAAATRLVEALQSVVADGLPPAFIVHDATHLHSADQAYALQFAAAMRALPRGVVHLAVIPKMWMRLLARTAAVLSGAEMHMFHTVDEAEAYLARHAGAAA